MQLNSSCVWRWLQHEMMITANDSQVENLSHSTLTFHVDGVVCRYRLYLIVTRGMASGGMVNLIIEETNLDGETSIIPEGRSYIAEITI